MKLLAVFVLFSVGICVRSASINVDANSTTEMTLAPVSGITDTAPTLGPVTEATNTAATIQPASVTTENAPTIQPISTGSSPIITFIPVESTTSSAPTLGPTTSDSSSFDGASFGGGIALGIGLCIIALVAYKCYAERRANGYKTM